jgi:subtilisin-like proprotein convertase family protein
LNFKAYVARALSVAFFLSLPLLYFNCSGGFKSYSSSSESGSSVIDYIGSYAMPAGSSGPIQAFQDREFMLTPSGSDPGPFTVTGLPAWATFNATTGQIRGVASTMADGATVSLHGVTDSYGPYTISIVGNPLKEYQWHLKNTGQTSFALTAGTAGEDLHMSGSVASGYTGRGVRIAISDTGVFLAHEALAPNVLAGESRNYMVAAPWKGDPTPDLNEADLAHGTSVASLAAEAGWNLRGGRGVAPEAKFAGFLFIQAQDALAQAGTLTAGIGDQFSGDFDIFNYSWTDPQCALIEYPATLKDKVKAAVMQQRAGKGSIHLMAGGNNYFDDIQSCFANVASSTVYDNINFSEMNTNPYVVNIGAVNALGVSSSYSTPGSALWVSAPGGEYGWDTTVANIPPVAFMPAIVGADFYGCASGIKTEDKDHSAFDRGSGLNGECKYVSTMNGTSAATPIASGAVALMLQANPNLTWRDVKYILAKTADKINPGSNPSTHPSATYNLAGHAYDQGWVTNAAGFNFHNYYGFGRINVDNAVNMARVYASGTLGTYSETNWVQDSGALAVAIPDASATGLARSLAVSQNLKVEAVQLRVSISGCAGDIGLELTSPAGTKSVVMNINSRIQDGAIDDHTFLTNAFYGEPSAGTWTLHVYDGYPGCTANLTNWKLNFAGHPGN